MSNFRNTQDLLDGVLRRCGEITSDVGISPRTNQALLYLNQIHHNVISGGCELDIDVDENWPWARARHPIILQLNPAITSGTCALTYGSVTGSFSTAPQLQGSSISVEGWYLKPTSGPEVYRITTHTAGQTAFSLDAAYPQSTNSALSFYCYQLDYDLITQYVSVDKESDTLDFIEAGSTVKTASIAHGSYTPAAYATAVATALNAAGVLGNTYSCSYDSGKRLFTVTSNLTAGSSVFAPQGATVNYYRSGWTTGLGFDFLNYTGAASYTGQYPLSSVIKLTQSARIYYGSSYFEGKSGQVSLIDPVRFDRDYPLVGIRAGAPDCFTIIREKADGTLTVRFNSYVWGNTNVQAMRVEFDHISSPKDLQNNAFSVPILPRKFIRILEYGAAYYVLKDKSDAKAQDYLQIAQSTLQGMVKVNRKELEKAGRNFGNVIARPDLTSGRNFRRNLYGYDSTE